MKDFVFKVRHSGTSTYLMMEHKPCDEVLGYPKNLADALTIMLGHECKEK